ncbi:MAG: TadE/TadG family type IV pilus assembly protein [Pseudomonadota bacterium]
MRFLIRVTNRFWRQQTGVTAIEYGILGPIFFSLILTGAEVGWVMIREASLEHAVRVASREVYLGKAKAGNMTQADLEKIMCEQMTMMTNCEQNLAVEMQVVSSFSAIPANSIQCREADVPLDTEIVYQNGDESEIVMMRVCASIPTLTDVGPFALGLPKTAQGNYQIVSTDVFMVRKFK